MFYEDDLAISLPGLLRSAKGEIRGDIGAVPLPSPSEGEVNDLAWAMNRVESLESMKQYRPLLGNVERFSKRMTEWPPEENGPRRFHFFGELTDNRDSYRRDANTFDCSLDQPNGLIAKSSGGSQHDDINPLCFEFVCNLRSGFLNECQNMMTVNVTHESIVGLCNPTHDALSREFIEPLNRKDDIDILVGIGVIIVIMGDPEFIDQPSGADLPESRIPKGISHVKRFLIDVMHACCRDNCDFGIAQRSPYGCPRYVLRFPGGIGLDESLRQRGKPPQDFCECPVL